MVKLEEATKQRAAGTYLTIGPSRVGQTSLQHGTKTDTDERYVLLDKPEANHNANITCQHSIGLSHTIPAVVTHFLTTLTLRIFTEVLQYKVKAKSEGTMGIDDTGVYTKVTFSTST